MSPKLDAIEKRVIVRGAAVYLVLLSAVVLSARLGLIPGAGQVGPPGGAFAHSYRLLMAGAGFLLAALLGTWSAVSGAAMRRRWLGLVILAVGGGVALLASGLAPAVLYPGDRYPVAFGWTLMGAPVALVTWLAATIGGRVAREVRAARPLA